MEFKNDDEEMKRIYYASLHPYGFEDIKYGKHQNQILTTHRQDIKERTDTYNANNSKGKFNIHNKTINEMKDTFKSTANAFNIMGKPQENHPYGGEDIQNVMNSYSANKQQEPSLSEELSKFILKAFIVGAVIMGILILAYYVVPKMK